MMNLTLLFASHLIAPAPCPTAPGADLLASVPSEAVVVISARDLDGLRSRAAEHAWAQFLADPELEAVSAYLAEQGVSWDALMADSELPLDPLAFCDSIHDSIVAFVAPIGAEREPGFGLLFAPGQDRAAFEDHFDSLLELFDNELVGSSDLYGDVEIAVFEQPEQSEDADLVSFEFGDVAAIVGSSSADHALELAHGVIDRLAGQSGAAAASEADSLAEARTSAGGRRSLEAFVDLQAIFELAGEEDEDVMEVVQAIGLTDMRWLYLSAELGAGEELDVSVSIHVPEESYLAAYLDLFGPLPLELGDFLPADATSVSLGSFDVFGAWSTTLDILAAEAPAQLEQLQAGLDMVSTSTGLDIEQDLLAQISGTFATFMGPVPPEEIEASMGSMSTLGVDAGSFDQGTATIVGLVDPDVVELFVEDALSQGQMYALVEQEEFQGELINSIVMPGMGGLYWSFTDGALVLSEFPTALRAALRKPGHGDSESALDTPRFKERLHGRTDASTVSIADTGQTVRMMLAAGEMIRDLAANTGEAPAELTHMPLPDPSIATRYFSGTLRSALTRKADSIVLTISGK